MLLLPLTDWDILTGKTGLGFGASAGDASRPVTKFDCQGLCRTLMRFLSILDDRHGGHLQCDGDSLLARARDQPGRQCGGGHSAAPCDGDFNYIKALSMNALWSLKSGGAGAIQVLATGQCGLADGAVADQWRMPHGGEMLSLSGRASQWPSIADILSLAKRGKRARHYQKEA